MTAETEIWKRRRMGHLLLHLNARENWKLATVANIIKLKKEVTELKDVDFPGVTDLTFPKNWDLLNEANSIKFILGDRYTKGMKFQEALNEVRSFVYQGKENGVEDGTNQ